MVQLLPTIIPFEIGGYIGLGVLLNPKSPNVCISCKIRTQFQQARGGMVDQ